MRLTSILLLITLCLISLILLFQIYGLLPFVFIGISFSLLFVSTKRKSLNRTLRILGTFIILHLVVFPFAYLYLLNNNSISFELDNYINSYEKQYALNSVKEKLNSAQLESRIDLIENLLEDGSNNLFLTLHEIYTSKNVFFLNNYLISGHIEYKLGRPGSSIRNLRYISVYDKFGNHLKNLSEFNGEKEKDIDGVFNDFLVREKKSLETNLETYLDISKNIENHGRFWNYPRILPYVINILYTDNLKPKSREANVLFFSHNLIVVVFVISVLGSSLYSVLNKSQHEAN